MENVDVEIRILKFGNFSNSLLILTVILKLIFSSENYDKIEEIIHLFNKESKNGK